jgi:hypothetical protein
MPYSNFEYVDDHQLIEDLKNLMADKFQMEEEALQAGIRRDEVNRLIELGRSIGLLENELSHRGINGL